eukprot:1183520-Prorocentrum_minimum.AAC.3
MLVSCTTSHEPCGFAVGWVGKRKGTYGDRVLVEDDVVGEATVVHEGDLLALGNGDGGGLEHERTGVRAELDGGSVGGGGQGQGQSTGSSGLHDSQQARKGCIGIMIQAAKSDIKAVLLRFTTSQDNILDLTSWVSW